MELIKGHVKKFGNQQYNRIKAACIDEGTLWEDPLFPAAKTSLFLGDPPEGFNPEDVVWKRPGDISDDPKLFVDGASSLDVKQGGLGNCWFVAACGDLACNRKLMKAVVPEADNQEWSSGSHAGIFRFRFWIFGHWTEVCIDDRLPTLHGRLLYVYSATSNEFWSSLVEKAYAKVNGCYQNLDGGNTGDALTDFTGGINDSSSLTALRALVPISKNDENGESEANANVEGTVKMNSTLQKSRRVSASGQIAGKDIHFMDARKKLFKLAKKAHKRGALMSASISVENGQDMEAVLPCGLVVGHAYGITDVRIIHKLAMIRLRNPWGAKEWNGAWSDQSPEWQSLSARDRSKLGLDDADDGEFFMSFDDFCEHFTTFNTCSVINTTILNARKTFFMTMQHNSWVGDSAGGCRNEPTFMNNPQYLLHQPVDSQVVVGLHQADMRMQRHLGKENATIGLQIMRVEENRRFRLHKSLPSIAKTAYINSREVVIKATLPKGRYIIIPTTFKPNVETTFLLRIFKSHMQPFRLLQPRTAKKASCRRGGHGAFARGVTRISIVSAVELVRSSGDTDAESIDPYVYVSCGKEHATGPSFKDNPNPAFNQSFIFYPKNPATSKLIVTVYDSNILKDSFCGSVEIDIGTYTKDDKVDGIWEISKKLLDRDLKAEHGGTILLRIQASFEADL